VQEIFITKDASPTLISEKFGVAYHSLNGAVTETQVVFINAGLHFQIQNGYQEIHILEYGFGTGLNVFETIRAVENLEIKINLHTLEAFPISESDAIAFLSALHLTEKYKNIFLQLHTCQWDTTIQIAENVTFTKHLQGFDTFDFTLKFDLIYFDCFAPESQPQFWESIFLKKVFLQLQESGVLTTYCAKGSFKRNLKEVGFEIEPLPGPPGKREMTRAIKII
jgi:tRNA U34 5-methylaminomethyl-2-thiouridine-forming methyltransferase MnmC